MTNQGTARLVTRDLAIGYAAGKRDARVLASKINLSVPAGRLICLLGPNGCGKSTLIRTLSGLQPAMEGAVEIEGQAMESLDSQQLARIRSVVLTERPQVGLLTVRALVALGRHPHSRWSGGLTERDEQVVDEALDAVDARSLAHRYAGNLSDGELQRVMIARALAQEAALMFLDEPSAFLDLPRRVELMDVLRKLVVSRKMSVVLSTHDLDLALQAADALWLMDAEGGLYTGAPEDLVLQGDLEKVFGGERIRFDLQSGHFRVTTGTCLPIALEGEGVEIEWTRRALRRIGYDVRSRTEAELVVRVAGTQWTLSRKGEEQTVSSLAALTDLLRGC